MMRVYKILNKILPEDLYIYFQNKKRLLELPSSIRKIVRNLGSDDICIDCGANVGVYSQLFAKYGSQVYSFEPNPVAFNILKKKTKKLKNNIVKEKSNWSFWLYALVIPGGMIGIILLLGNISS